MKDRIERLQNKTAITKKGRSSRNNQSVNQKYSSKLTDVKLAGGCKSTINRRYKAPVEHKLSSPIYHKEHFSYFDDHTNNFSEDLNECLLDTEDDFHAENEHLDFECNKDQKFEVDGVETHGNNLKLCSRYCNFNSRLNYFPLLNDHLDKCAIVILTDILKDNTADFKMNADNCKEVGQIVPSKVSKMKPSNSKSPGRLSIAKPTQGNESPSVRTTYVKPSDKDTLVDGSKPSPSAKVSSLKDLSKGKPLNENTSITKTESPVTRCASPDRNITPLKKGKEKTKSVKKKESAVCEETSSSKKKRGKSKKTVDSPSLNNKELEQPFDAIEQQVTPSKNDKKPVKTPRGRKKTTENITPSMDEVPVDKKVSKKASSRSRNVSESPSPRRKLSPKKSPEKASPKSTKKMKSYAQDAEAEAKNSVDDSDNAENFGSDKVDSSKKVKKSPVKKQGKPDSPAKKHCVNESKEIIKDEKSPKRKSKNSPANSCTKKKLKDSPGDTSEQKNSLGKNKSASPKKRKNSSDIKAAKTMSKKLDFDDEISKVIYQSSRLALPPDFEYKYTSGIQTSGPVDLNHLISKINDAMKENNKELTELFGETEELVEDGDDKIVSPESSVLSTSTDSDKTILDFDTQSNLSVQEDSNVNQLQDCNETDDNGNKTCDDTSEKAVESEKDVEKLFSVNESKNEVRGSDFKGDVKDKPCESVEDIDNSTVKNDNLTTAENVPVTTNTDKDESIEQLEQTETVSVFELYGLTLKRKRSLIGNDKIQTNESAEVKCESNKNDSFSKTELKVDVDYANEVSVKDNIVVLSDTETDTVELKNNDTVIILSDEEDERVDRTGYESLKESYEKKIRPKFTTVNNIVEPKPLEILSRIEKAEPKKESAFSCDELDMYLNVHKHNSDFSYIPPGTNHFESDVKMEKLSKADIKELVTKTTPDLDEVDGFVFVSFSCEQALKAHVALEKKLDWLTVAQLKKLAQLRHMKERQNDFGAKRITDVKSIDEQKLNFRGIPMRLMKYQKMLKQEMEDILLGRQMSIERSPLKHPGKTTDITKIKGWKNKFQNQEELQEATGINISESGKVHWKTEERLVKNLDPEEIRDIGLDLKKKRRKLVNYSNRRKSNLGLKLDDKDADPMDYEYELDEFAITEHDVYNEDDDKPPPDKIPYKCKYLSQHKYGARKLFVKRMKLDAEDERILQKLGTQKMKLEEGNQCILKTKKQACMQVSLNKITHNMAVAAVSAFDKKLLSKAKLMAKTEKSRQKKKEAKEASSIKMEVEDGGADFSEHHENVEDIPYEDNGEFSEIQIKQEPVDDTLEEVLPKRGRGRTKSRRQSSTSKSPGSIPNNFDNTDVVTEKVTKSEDRKGERASSETCAEPGCRYGCICHLCKLSDSGEEREADHRPQCDKEYCRLGCICDSIDTTMSEKQHCKKPGCMLECKCPPKQPKPDIPRERDGKRKKKGKVGRKKKQLIDKSELEISDKEENINDDGEWEPPSKRKKGASYSKRFTNLPKRQTTYRLAKNLDAVSRKAMEVYATSEMYAEQKVRRRRSDQGWEEDWVDKKVIPEPRLNEFTGVLEISDEEDSYPADVTSCARLLPYSGPYKQQPIVVDNRNKRDVSRLNKRKGGPSRKQFDPKEVIDLDSDSENGISRKDLPSTSSENQKKPPQTLTEKMGLVNLIKTEEVPKVEKVETCRWKTQMVCLKAKKKSEDKSQSSHAEIKLLEIMSNCNWEIDRTNMLSKISHIISKDSGADYPRSQCVNWGAYVLEFLPKADVPALIPPELKSKLPEHIFSIRIKVTKDQATASSTVPTGESASTDRYLTMEERKRHIMKWQKKLIDKIKFAERLRSLIINEEQNGVVTSKFSVSREGIEKALKKYKTQLWKAYTGSSNLTLQQLKQALQAAKTNAAAKSTEPETKMSGSRPNLLSSAAKARIQSNQGVTVVGSKSSRYQNQSFINLSNLSSGVSTPFSTGSQTSFGNIVIHQAGTSGKSMQPSAGSSHTIGSASTSLVSTKSSSAHGSIVTAMQTQPVNCKATNLIDKNSKPVENETNLSKPILLQPSLQATGPGPAVSLSNPDSSKSQSVVVPGMFEDVVLMPLDKNMNPKNLPRGMKLAVLQTVSKVNETTSSGSVSLLAPAGNQPFKMKTVVLSSAAVISAGSTNLMTTKPCTTQVNGQNIRVASPIMSPVVISSLANVRPQSPSIMPGSKMTVTSGTSFVGTQPTSMPMTNMFPLKNISNFNSSVPSSAISNVTTVATSTICSPSIYPIQFANPIVTKPSTSEIHVVMPSRDMIGFPKVSSFPFKIFPTANTADGKAMQFLVPVTLPLNSSVAETSSHSTVSCQGIALCSISPTFVNSAANSTAVASASEHSTGAVKPAVIKQKKCRKKKFVDKQVVTTSTTGQEVEKEIDMEKIVFDNYHPVKSLAKNDEKSEKTLKDESKDSDSLAHSDAMLENNSQSTACVESSNGEKIDEIAENEDIKSNEQDPNVKDSILDIKIEDVKSIHPEHMDDCSDMSEQKPYVRSVKVVSSDAQSEELGVEMMPHSDLSNGKRASPDLLDLIDMEQTMKQMDEMENEAGIKNIHQINESVEDAIHIADSEESDVDIITCDLKETLAPGKRKTRYNASDDDDPQNKKFKLDESNNSCKSSPAIPRRTVKTSREKSRRHQLRCLFETLEQVVFKYNKEMQSLRGTVPKHLILQEAFGLIQALKQKNEILAESLEDGRHCKEVLEVQLSQQSREFVDLGVPAPIIKNFLKSVQRTSFPEYKRKGKKETSRHADSEDDDCTLDFKPLTQSRFKIPETYDSETGTSGNNSSCGERDVTLTNTLICSKDLQTTVESVDKPIIVSESLEETLMCDPLRNHHQAIAGDCVRDISSTQEKFANCVSQGSKDSLLSEMTSNSSDMTVDETIDHQEDNVVISDDEDIRSTTGDAMLDYENESVHSELSNENVDNIISNTEMLSNEIKSINE